MDTKFSVALHVLAMVSESSESLSSQKIAESVGTNASYIRKIIVLLNKANILESRQGKRGYSLSKSARDISLLEVYYATQEIDHIKLFDIHSNTSEECPVGRYIGEAVHDTFSPVEEHLERELASQNLEDVIENLYREASKSNSHKNNRNEK
ncbi:Rrf2 family transcriptional regulator [Alloscardovia theropitheci]|uniref:Rrf2 family transcriptional regulator n=1 Tax=Alloscardovia theropitheci TaxID=2496842 RepID=A0A4R0QNY3_9BIFI|nr:Rrf2 family transcriptional regulator [Alloscardovia theropitheci]